VAPDAGGLCAAPIRVSSVAEGVLITGRCAHRRIGLALGSLAAFLALAPSAWGVPQTITVDAKADDVDDNIGNSVCHTVANQCTLRAAIQESNDVANPDPDTINFDSSIAGTACRATPRLA